MAIKIGVEHAFGLKEFSRIVFEEGTLSFSSATRERLRQTTRFLDHLLANKKTVYGLTTGFADLRDKPVSPEEASQLSHNILQSHDAGIGPSLPKEVILGAMAIRANSLAKGYSGFREESLDTLIAMTNHRIIPSIPNTGSLGASGDLAFLARLGRAMQGSEVQVSYQGKEMSAGEALKLAGIQPFVPAAKEGLALTNGTAFMASMTGIAYMKQVHLLENMLAGLTLFLNGIEAIDAAFCESIHAVRGQDSQSRVAKLLLNSLRNSPFLNRQGVQNDYSIRCLPQIFGPRFAAIFDQRGIIDREMDAVTDNPLIFRGREISSDVDPGRILTFEGESWAVLSGGNFHGENTTVFADILLLNNAKIALTMERHLTYLLNPFRNRGSLPHYLVPNQEKIGLLSGYMITQYTANAVTQKMAQLGMPASLFNITSANESEDVVSYGATAAKTLLHQLELFEELITIYLTMTAQAYAIKREQYGKPIPEDSLAEQIFACINTDGTFPTRTDLPFGEIFARMASLLQTNRLREIQGHPLANWAMNW